LPRDSINRYLGRTSRWSLSRAVKKQVKKVTRFIGEYEGVLTMAAKKRGMDGVICGHIHFSACFEREGIAYLNTGDWVEDGTALVEGLDGHFEVVYQGEAVREEDKEESEPASLMGAARGGGDEIDVSRSLRGLVSSRHFPGPCYDWE